MKNALKVRAVAFDISGFEVDAVFEDSAVFSGVFEVFVILWCDCAFVFEEVDKGALDLGDKTGGLEGEQEIIKKPGGIDDLLEDGEDIFKQRAFEADVDGVSIGDLGDLFEEGEELGKIAFVFACDLCDSLDDFVEVLSEERGETCAEGADDRAFVGVGLSLCIEGFEQGADPDGEVEREGDTVVFEGKVTQQEGACVTEHTSEDGLREVAGVVDRLSVGEGFSAKAASVGVAGAKGGGWIGEARAFLGADGVSFEIDAQDAAFSEILVREAGIFLEEKIGDQAGALSFAAVVGAAEPVARCFEQSGKMAIFARGGCDAIVGESIASAKESDAFFHEFADLGERDDTAEDTGLSFEQRRRKADAQEQKVNGLHEGLILEGIGHGEREHAGESGHGVVVVEGKQCAQKGFEVGDHRGGDDLVDGDDDLFAHSLDSFDALCGERRVITGLTLNVFVDLKAEIALCGWSVGLAGGAASVGHGIDARMKRKDPESYEKK